MIHLRELSLAATRVRGVEGLVSLLPLMVASMLITSLAMAAGPGPVDWFFQSPISPVSPGPAESPGAPEATVTGPALVSVPVSPNFIPWLVGIVVVGAVVGAAMMWRRGSDEGGGDE